MDNAEDTRFCFRDNKQSMHITKKKKKRKCKHLKIEPSHIDHHR